MKKTFVGVLVLLLGGNVYAQQKESQSIETRVKKMEQTLSLLSKVKPSGYLQTQYQWGQRDASLRVGGKNETSDQSFSRFGIRRGRIKFTFEEKTTTGVFQIDITEKGVNVKDAYLSVKLPSLGNSWLKAGIFDRPFGYEITYSSNRRESPERATIFPTLFPDERDLGAMLTLQAPKESAWSFLRLHIALLAGNGIKAETDSRKDVIVRLDGQKKLTKTVDVGLGFSHYNGGVYQGTTKVYTMEGNGFTLSDVATNKGEYAKRRYWGVDTQWKVKTSLGNTELRAEYLWGQQPGTASSSKSPNAATLPTTDTYIRPFDGGYAMLVQQVPGLPLSAVLKYDWYDPNTKVSADGVGQNGTTATDIAYHTWGVGVVWDATSNVRLQAYYDLPKQETSANVAGYTADRKDNSFTLRLQYKF